MDSSNTTIEPKDGKKVGGAGSPPGQEDETVGESEIALPGEGSDAEKNFHDKPDKPEGDEGSIGEADELGLDDMGRSRSQFSLGGTRERNKSRYSAASSFHMKTQYGLFSCIALILCNVIGSGIFINPNDVYNKTQSTGISLIIWFGLGMHVTIGALCYAELGTTLPLSGGDYAYLSESFGSFVGFEFQFIANLLFIPAVNAILGFTVGKYFLQLICIYACVEIHDTTEATTSGTDDKNGTTGIFETTTAIKPHDPAEDFYGSLNWMNFYASMIGLGLIALITTINCLNGKAAEKMQNVLTICKLSACAMIGILGIVQISRGGFQSEIVFNLDKEQSFSSHAYDISTAIYEVSFSYSGWTYLNMITEELENPYRNLPIAIIVSMPLITFIYVFMNTCYFAALTPAQLQTTVGIASDTLKNVLGTQNLIQAFGWIAPVVVMISSFGGLTTHMNAASRISFVGARAGQLPSMFYQIHRSRQTPIPALILQGVLSAMYLGMQQLVTVIVMSVYAESFFSYLAVGALLYLRWKQPNLNRPIKLFIGIPIFFTLVSFTIFFIPIIGCFIDPKNVSSTVPTVGVPIGLFLLGIPVYFYFIKHPTCMDKFPFWLYSPKCQEKLNENMESGAERLLNLKRGE